jgi:bacteriocin biosynthesis cyclodehydratase domain-containing protein
MSVAEIEVTKPSFGHGVAVDEESAEKLQLAEVYLVPLGGGRLQLRSSGRTAVMSGGVVEELFPKLLPLLDGTRSERQIVDELRGTVEEARLRGAIKALRDRGFVRVVEEPPASIPDGSAAHYESVARFWGRSEPRWSTVAALREAHVAVVQGGAVLPALVSSLVHFGVGELTLVGDDRIRELDVQQSRHFTRKDVGAKRSEVLAERLPLSKLGVKLEAATEVPSTSVQWQQQLTSATAAVVLVEGPMLFHDWLDAFNAAALEAGLPWTTAALLDSQEIHIGPSVRPGMTACYKCFEHRLKSNMAFLPAYEEFEQFLRAASRDLVDFGHLPPVADIAGGLLAIEVARMISPEQIPLTSGRLMTFRSDTFETAFHPVLKIPRCPACSQTRRRPQERIWS